MATKRPAVKAKVVKKATARTVKRPEPIITTDVLAAVVDEIPAQRYGRSGRSMRYANVMADVRAKVGAGKAVRVATFAGRGGANVVRRALERGERPVDGELSDWEFATRVMGDGTSVLYVTLKS